MSEWSLVKKHKAEPFGLGEQVSHTVSDKEFNRLYSRGVQSTGPGAFCGMWQDFMWPFASTNILSKYLPALSY